MDTLWFGERRAKRRRVEIRPGGGIQGGLGESRAAAGEEPVGKYGGNVRFTMTCDPLKPTYLTVKFWGSDAGEELGRLLLFVEGKQLGVRHLGDIDSLDIPSSAPRFLGVFYKTLPLPKEMTKGKSSSIWRFGRLGKFGLREHVGGNPAADDGAIAGDLQCLHSYGSVFCGSFGRTTGSVGRSTVTSNAGG